MSEITVHVDPENIQVVQIVVDENSAQSAIDAAEAAQAALAAIANTNFGNKLDKGGYVGTAQTLKDDIDAIVLPDGVTKPGSIIVNSGSAFVPAADFIWRKDQVEYTNTLAFSTPVPASANGYMRTDIFVGTKLNTIVRVPGPESIGIAIEPDVPVDTVKLGSVDIEGATVGVPVIVRPKGEVISVNGLKGIVVLGKADIGLGNVDNTSDANKPVSTLQAAADAVVLADGKAYADGLITQIINGAPADANTLKELNDKILAVQAIIGGATEDGDSLVNTVAELLAVFSTYSEGVDLVSLLAGKVDKTDIYNALDCIVAGKVLDARQGKVLNDLITALTTAVSGKEPANANIQVHIASAHAPSNAQKNSDITKAEIEAKLIGEITTHTHPSTVGLTVTQVTAQTLTAASWTLVSGFYEYNLSNANITTTSIVDVIPDNASVPIVQVAQVLPRTLSGIGTVKLYSTNLPTGNIVVTINIWK